VASGISRDIYEYVGTV